MSIAIDKENCEVCSKVVYPTERTAADSKVFHKSCFRCKTCNNVLKLGSFASMEGVFFCKPCFKKNFFSKGNYSSGFGKLTPQQEHDLKNGKVTDGNGISTPVKDFSKPPAKESPKESPKEVPKPIVKESPKESPKEAPKPIVKEVAKESPKESPVKESAKNTSRSLPSAPVKSDSSTKVEVPKETPKEVAKPVEPVRVVSPPPPTKTVVSTPVKSEPSKTEKVDSPSEKKNKCNVCGKSVYPMEELKADEKIFHKTCFRCKKCNSILKLGSFASMEGEFFCKNCFKKNFFSKGNYSDGFGKLTPQQEHDAKTGRDPTKAFAIGSFSGMENAKKTSFIQEKKVEEKKVEEKKVEVKKETKPTPIQEPKKEEAPKKEEEAPKKEEEPKKEEVPTDEVAETKKEVDTPQEEETVKAPVTPHAEGEEQKDENSAEEIVE